MGTHLEMHAHTAQHVRTQLDKHTPAHENMPVGVHTDVPPTHENVLGHTHTRNPNLGGHTLTHSREVTTRISTWENTPGHVALQHEDETARLGVSPQLLPTHVCTHMPVSTCTPTWVNMPGDHICQQTYGGDPLPPPCMWEASHTSAMLLPGSGNWSKHRSAPPPTAFMVNPQMARSWAAGGEAPAWGEELTATSVCPSHSPEGHQAVANGRPGTDHLSRQ